ncbi:GumC family protein [Flagellimonas eckloniae]|uniref:non-specific protein-tyrosine kinase n=1 Tax=Flagellimonas eckloniae TaxID=346185 RepID=A0A0Q0XDU6_9FLAO|nr:tyrosine-protein kinase family protein [Allomuricauda eckloniae]KQC29327.1 tyrosine protein kinase [Allomuricauda eckloniae]
MDFREHEPQLESKDLKQFISTYTKHWKYFILSGIFCLVGAYLFIRYATPEYKAQGSIQIIDEKGSSTGLDLFKELDLLSSGKNNVEDEIQIIKSRSSLIEVVKELGLNVTILEMGNIKNSELYSNPPINLNFISEDSITDKSKQDFTVKISGDTTFEFSVEEGAPSKAYAFGNNFDTPMGSIVITPNTSNYRKYLGKNLKIQIRPISDVARQYQNKIKISLTEDFSNILNISLQDKNKAKAKDIINQLVKVYNENAIQDKKTIADRTSNFINERIAEISGSLSSVDQSAEDFKSNKGLTDITSESNINLNIGATNQQELANVETQYNIASSMKDLVDSQNGFEVLPTNIGLSDQTIASTTQKYNQLVLERDRLLKSSNDKNPVIINLNQELASLKNTMQSSLNSTVNNLGLRVNSLSEQQSIIRSKIYSAPKNERALRDITRQQQTTESLYLYLLQKREEAQIAVASASPKSKTIDDAYIPDSEPASPRKKVIYLASLVLAFLIPFSVIYANEMLDSKVHNMYEVDILAKDFPVLGELPALTKNEEKIISKDDRSVLSEALRILRTNLDFLIKTNKTESNKNNIVFVTSSVPGEGKTFLSSNLSMILASTGKKVILIGADIRNPKLHSFFSDLDHDNMRNERPNKDLGLTEYLFNDELRFKDVLHSMKVYDNEIDVVYSGMVPPNPSELLMNSRMKPFLDEASDKYDYVIVDTAPLMVVSDTLLIADNADHLVYVTRAGITEKKAIEYPIKLSKEGKVRGLCFVVNDVKSADLGYAGKYGYGYGTSQKKWWKF